MKEETKKNILEKGMGLIFKSGYHSVGLQKILDQAGIPKGSFYYYFKSKEDFGLQVLDFYAAESLLFMKSFLEDKDLDPRQRIFKLLETVKDLYTEQGYLQGCLLGNSSLELAAQKVVFAEKISQKFTEWQALFVRTIQQGQDLGSIPGQRSAEDLAAFLLNSWEGALVRMKSTRNNEPMDLFISFMQEII